MIYLCSQFLSHDTCKPYRVKRFTAVQTADRLSQYNAVESLTRERTRDLQNRGSPCSCENFSRLQRIFQVQSARFPQGLPNFKRGRSVGRRHNTRVLETKSDP